MCMNNLLNYSIKVDSMEAEHKIYDTYSSFYEDNINIFVINHYYTHIQQLEI